MRTRHIATWGLLIFLLLLSIHAASSQENQKVPLILQNTDGLTLAQPGDTITYYIRYTNTNTEEAMGIRITDRLPEGVTFVSSTEGGKYEDGTVVWKDLGNLGSGESDSVQITVTVDMGTTWEIKNMAIAEAEDIPKSGTFDVTDIKPQQEIPEFPTIALPIATIIAVAFILQRKKK